MVEAKIRPFDDLIAAYQEYSARYDFIKDPVHLYEPVGYIMRQGGKNQTSGLVDGTEYL